MATERILTAGSHRFTKVVCLDEPGAGGACHIYRVESADPDAPTAIFGHIQFQNGPVVENGINGLHQEDLLHIVVDRLRHFQQGSFACRENELALTKIEEAIHWLNHRTAERQARGVEGTTKK
mgnify:FL=1